MADKSPGSRIGKDILELSLFIKEIHRHDNRTQFGQRVINQCPIKRVGHHQNAKIPGFKTQTGKSMG